MKLHNKGQETLTSQLHDETNRDADKFGHVVKRKA